MALWLLAACSALLANAAPTLPPTTTVRPTQPPSAISKVTMLIQKMKAQVEEEAKEDEETYDKYACWCETTEKEKEAAIASAEKTIAELEAFLESAAAKTGMLETEIAEVKRGIAEDQEALATATAVREKEHDAFVNEEADMKESAGLLKQAVDVLSKVQLAQKSAAAAPPAADLQAAVAALVQVKRVVQHSVRFGDVMRQDLFDVLGSLQEAADGSALLSGQTDSFLGPKRGSAQTVLALDQDEQQAEDAPVEKVVSDVKPNDLIGAAAGAKSYNSRSGSIFGMLGEMHDEFLRDLGVAQREELQALIEFQNLRSAKLSEIAAGTEQKEEKETQLADLKNKVAKADEDKVSLGEQLAADQEFLGEMRKDCKAEDEHYKARVSVRSEEIRALGETIAILTDDASRDLFGKTVTLVQVSAMSKAQAAAQDRRAESAMKRLAEVAKRHKNWAMVSLAVRVRLDAFTKVKVAMDQMLGQLQKQQKEEYDKWEFCKKEIDHTEDQIKEGENKQEDLAEKHKALVNTLSQLDDDIAKTKAEVKDMEVSLKRAGEDRHAANLLFKSSVTDQRATVEILNKALARLRQFYAPEGPAFAQSSRESGANSAPPPPKPKEYSKSASAGGVLQLLQKVIEEAEVAETELTTSEQNAQEEYAALVRDTTASIEAARTVIEEKTEQRAEALALKSETQAAQSANDEELAKLNDLLRAHHLDCDYILKFFDVRQKARAEEMDAIEDAKAILSGADFGK